MGRRGIVEGVVAYVRAPVFFIILLYGMVWEMAWYGKWYGMVYDGIVDDYECVGRCRESWTIDPDIRLFPFHFDSCGSQEHVL